MPLSRASRAKAIAARPSARSRRLPGSHRVPAGCTATSAPRKTCSWRPSSCTATVAGRGVVRDISERKRAEEARLHLQAEPVGGVLGDLGVGAQQHAPRVAVGGDEPVRFGEGRGGRPLDGTDGRALRLPVELGREARVGTDGGAVSRAGRSVGRPDPKFASPRCARWVGRSGAPSRKRSLRIF